MTKKINREPLELTITLPRRGRKRPHTTREAWLLQAGSLLDKAFFGKKYPLPKWAVSCGPCSGKAIGQCWDPVQAADGTTHMFIDPALDAPLRVLDVLLHEMVHAQVGCEHNHKKPFIERIREIGLKGKPTATYAEEGTEVHAKLSKMLPVLGPYPHRALVAKKAPTKGGGWTRLMSPNEEELGGKYRVMISPKMLEEHGFPKDPFGDDMILIEES